MTAASLFASKPVFEPELVFVGIKPGWVGPFAMARDMRETPAAQPMMPATSAPLAAPRAAPLPLGPAATMPPRGVQALPPRTLPPRTVVPASQARGLASGMPPQAIGRQKPLPLPPADATVDPALYDQDPAEAGTGDDAHE